MHMGIVFYDDGLHDEGGGVYDYALKNNENGTHFR